MLVTSRPNLVPERCRYYPKDKGYALLQDWHVTANDGVDYVVPKGFWFNGGSIPKLFWQVTFTPFDPDIIDGFLLHDWAYTSHVMDKQTADDSLQDFIQSSGFSVRANLVATAVRMFGKSSWEHTLTDRNYLDSLKWTLKYNGLDLKTYKL